MRDQIDLLMNNIIEYSYVCFFLDHVASRDYFTYFWLVWDTSIIFSSSLVQLREHHVVAELLEDKQYWGREDCDVPFH